ncbi:hypothetical protein EVG20_g10394 [Dentipellis fragilis]|uniref:Uncharacterized protein n=1 Tax=Dentipellis fragilis TaxID=205917 RepID=A0A4Y9XW77_9AGAM|nr:hypothetical protein EVG20_g10394 [Dentipellis fragilis]
MRRKANEGWAWTCLQEKSHSGRADQTRLDNSPTLWDCVRSPDAHVPRIGDDIAIYRSLLSFPLRFALLFRFRFLWLSGILTGLRYSQATLARVSALVAAQKEPKEAPPKKLRGKKAHLGLV